MDTLELNKEYFVRSKITGIEETARCIYWRGKPMFEFYGRDEIYDPEDFDVLRSRDE
jgi:hypothetical protein